MVLIVRAEYVEPTAKYTVYLDLGEIKLCSMKMESNPRNVLGATQILTQRNLNPRIMVHLSYRSRNGKIHNYHETISPEKLERIASGEDSYPKYRFEQVYNNVSQAHMNE